MNISLTFREIDGLWVAVDSACQTPPILSDFINKLQIVIDDNTQFCRIIKYNGKVKTTITYKAYTGSTVRICINTHKIE